MKKSRIFKTLWGVNIDFEINKLRTLLQSFKNEGFEGIEIATGFFDKKYKNEFNKVRKEVGLDLITQIHTCGYPIIERQYGKHFDDYRSKIEESMTWDPVLINCHSGRDDWKQEETLIYYRKVNEYEKENFDNFKNENKFKFKISHEGHRQRALFTPWITHEILKTFPDLFHTADISNWVVVAERLFNTRTDPEWENIINLLGKKTLLIHARMSTADQIQVDDPNSSDNSEYKQYYYNLWKQLYDNSESTTMLITPEYGPYPFASLNPQKYNNSKQIDTIVSEELSELKKLFN